MKKILLFLSASFIVLGAYSQNCETTPPSSVKVRTSDGDHVGSGDALWICENVTFEIVGQSNTVYAESGTSITITGNDQNTIYVKGPSTLTINGNGAGTYIVDDDVTVNGSAAGSASITTCMDPDSVVYNYDNVPATPGCIDTTNTVGINKRIQKEEVKIYPNPASTVINVELSAELVNSEYRIYSISGKIVLQGRLDNNNTQLDITSLEKGLYFVEIENSLGKVSKRISVE